MSGEVLLPGPFGDKLGQELTVKPAVENLVHAQIGALLATSPSFDELSPGEQEAMKANMRKIAAYTAALINEDWKLTEQLNQKPLVRQTKTVEYENPSAIERTTAGLATALNERTAAEEFAPRAASNVARVTEDTLNAIAFPTFVADLIKGTFNAIVDASIQQMEAFGELLSNVAKTVDEFMADNITDNMAVDWVVGAFPRNFEVGEGQERATLAPREDLNDDEEGRLRRTLNIPVDVDLSDLEGFVVPAARRKIAQNRQQLLSSMVLMGINRIVVTRGRIKAQMGFRIDTKDTARASASRKFDFKNETTAKYGAFFSPVSVKSKTTVAYVSSSEKDSESELNVGANLTGEVDLQFKSDVFPLERFADAGVISSIQSNTANPAGNQPVTSSPDS